MELYNENIIKGIKVETKKAMKNLVRETKATAPKGKHSGRHYSDNIKSRKVYENNRGVSYQWYVDDPDYRLSHLLEYGHALKNGGRSKEFHFIEKASKPILKDYDKAIKEVIKNG